MGFNQEALINADFEFLVLLSGLDDTFSQNINSFTSYKANEIIWGAKFTDILESQSDGILSIDLNRIHEHRLVDLPKAG